MPLGILNTGTVTFQPRKPGVYETPTSGIGKPKNELRVTAGRLNVKTKKATMAVTRVFQKDFTAPGSTTVVRDEAVVSVSWSIPTTGSISETDAFNLMQEIALVITPEILKRVYAGEN